MALALERESLDGLDEATAALYKASGTGYALDIDGTSDEGLRKALAAERSLHKDETRARRDAERTAQAAADVAAAAQAERDRARAAADAMRARIFADAVAAAAQASGLHGAAIPDALRAAKEKFVVDDDGNVTAAEGARGSLLEWMQAARVSAPHWFPAPTGTGSRESSRGASGPWTMSRGSFDALSAAQKSACLRDGLQIRD